MATHNWKQFTRRITINASAKAIYDAWTTQQGLESWFLRLAEFKKPDGTTRSRIDHAQAGDQYHWRWFGYDDSAEEKRQILLANGWDQFRFEFSGGCIVTIKILQDQGENICELIQDMPMDEISEQQFFFIECGKGWAFYITNLKSILEGGIDLRNKNLQIQDVLNA